MYIGRNPNGEVRYTFTGKNGMKYTTPELRLSKKNKLYCPWITEYNPNTKQRVMLKFKDNMYYRESDFFIKTIPLFKEEEKEQSICDHDTEI